MNLTTDDNGENNNYPSERVDSNIQSQNNNSFMKKILKNNLIFYGLMCSISLFFLIFSRDLIKKSFIYQENQKYRVLEQTEEEKTNKILRRLQAENNNYEIDSSQFEDVRCSIANWLF